MIRMRRKMMKKRKMERKCKKKMLKWRVMIMRRSQLNNTKLENK